MSGKSNEVCTEKWSEPDSQSVETFLACKLNDAMRTHDNLYLRSSTWPWTLQTGVLGLWAWVTARVANMAAANRNTRETRNCILGPSRGACVVLQIRIKNMRLIYCSQRKHSWESKKMQDKKTFHIQWHTIYIMKDYHKIYNACYGKEIFYLRYFQRYWWDKLY